MLKSYLHNRLNYCNYHAFHTFAICIVIVMQIKLTVVVGMGGGGGARGECEVLKNYSCK